MCSPRGTLLIQYRYDPLDRLADCSPTGLPSHQRFYQKNRLAVEIHGQVKHAFFQGQDTLLAQQQHQGATRDTTLLATDSQRSVLYALERTQERAIAYMPYGHRAAESGLLSLLGFNGERTDPVTGHYLLGNGYRAFNAVLMRFNSPDSLSPFGKGGVNAYAYGEGDPINIVDPTGHFGVSEFFRLLATPVRRTSRLLRAPRRLATIGKVPSAAASAAPSVSPSPVGAFARLQGMPGVLENILNQLPGKDMVSLASTSEAMNRFVSSAAKPRLLLIKELGTELPLAMRGQVKGALPSIARNAYKEIKPTLNKYDQVVEGFRGVRDIRGFGEDMSVKVRILMVEMQIAKRRYPPTTKYYATRRMW
ncbi:RHS repeat-associated core domain-containing protein [Pseudomonas batumici]|uniref:YD repeat protein n=1 Tax=Pseudomonas batumici TaxID=226910 RepID=A0A0C2EZY3_9PSED|nr:RHS repeat-associated core domain-containing protein [Pseudomonas batumici]KIH84403.1 YD repeat protein [Pseudomonas batumici]